MARLVLKQPLGVFSLLPVRHLINILYCAKVPGSNINTYTHKPGTLYEHTAHRPAFQGLRKSEVTVQNHFSAFRDARVCLYLPIKLHWTFRKELQIIFFIGSTN